MIKSLFIKNFRGFSSLEVLGLQRVNVITGTNASGKTSLLEAVFLCAGSGALNVALQLRIFRQLSARIELVIDIPNYEGLWEDLFYGVDSGKVIEIRGVGDNNDSRSLRIYNEHRSVQVLPFGNQSVASPFKPQIVSEWRRNDEPPIEVRPKIEARGLVFDNIPFDHFPVMMFGPHIADTAEEIAKRYSQLSRSGKSDLVVQALCEEFDFIESLTLEYTSGSPSVFAKLKYQDAKLALGFVSDGVHKLFSLLLGIALSPDGMVLIDQIEDGFYYKRFPAIWRIIYKFAKENNCQLFITSHSSECLKAMLPTIRGNEEDFSLLHVDRIKDIVFVHTVEGRFFEAALDNGLEMR